MVHRALPCTPKQDLSLSKCSNNAPNLRSTCTLTNIITPNVPHKRRFYRITGLQNCYYSMISDNEMDRRCSCWSVEICTTMPRPGDSRSMCTDYICATHVNSGIKTLEATLLVQKYHRYLFRFSIRQSTYHGMIERGSSIMP